MVSEGGFPLLLAPASSGPIAVEPAAPAAWTEEFYDNFAGTSLDSAKWKIRYADTSNASGTMQWHTSGVVINNGLTLRTYKSGDIWYGGGIQIGNSTLGTAGWGDFQLTVKARFPQGKGVGAYAAMLPVASTAPPEFNTSVTSAQAKDNVRVTWRYPANATGVSRTYAVNATGDHLYTVRRTGDVWNYWIDGAEQAVPPEWAQNPDAAKLTLGLAAFVGSAADAPDATTPTTWDAFVSYVRVHAPTPTTTTPNPQAPVGFAQAKAASNTVATTSVSISLDAPATAGNLILVYSTPDKTAASIPPPTGFTLVPGMQHLTGPGVSGALFYKIAAGGEQSITCTHTGDSTIFFAAAAIELSNVRADAPIDLSVINIGNTKPELDPRTLALSTGTSITSSANQMAVAFWSVDSLNSIDSATSVGWNGGFTARTDVGVTTRSAGSQPGLSVATLPVLTQGSTVSTAFSWTGDTDDERMGILVTVRPAAASTTTPPPTGGGTATIAIDPSDPGALTETVAGQGASRSFTINTTNLTAFDWVVVRSDYSWRTTAVRVNTTGAASITVTFLQTGEFIKVMNAADTNVYTDSGPVTVNPAPDSGEPSTATDVDAEYPVYVGTPVPPGKAGPLQTGQSNCGYFIQEAIWHENGGLASTLGVAQGYYNPQISGLDSVDAYGLLEGAKTTPFAAYTAVGGVPLYESGDAYPFLDTTTGATHADYPYGQSGQAMHNFITQIMTAEERSGCLGVQVLHHERDSELRTNVVTYKAARLNWMAKVRASFGRPSTGSTGLPFFFVYPHPYGSSNTGHQVIRQAFSEICADLANNAHIVVAQTCDSWGGLRFGETVNRDYSHRSTEDLIRFARMATFGVTRVISSQRGVGSRNLPSLGPKMIHSHAEDATHTVITCAHDRGTTLRLGGSAGDGRGWQIWDDVTGRAVTAVAVVNATQLRLTHAACTGTAAQRKVSYCLYGQELGQGNGIYDNFSSRPNPTGWPAGFGSEWKFDWPLRGSLVEMASEAASHSGRNLYLDSATFNGANVAGADLDLMDPGTQSFTFTKA
jgi:hypothetical protein